MTWNMPNATRLNRGSHRDSPKDGRLDGCLDGRADSCPNGHRDSRLDSHLDGQQSVTSYKWEGNVPRGVRTGNGCYKKSIKKQVRASPLQFCPKGTREINQPALPSSSSKNNRKLREAISGR